MQNEMRTKLAAVLLSLAVTTFPAGVAHADPASAGCDVGKTYLNLASTMVPGLANTPILGPNSIQSEGQLVAKWVTQGYGFDAINAQVSRDLNVDTYTAAALMGYTGCDIP
jgi:hypothetical protein